MPVVSILLKCACSAQLELALDDENAPARELHDRIRKDSSAWQKLHAAHTSARSAPRKRPLGFHTSAISNDYNNGEDEFGWQGMWASPSDGGDDED